jgi:hypothetical protein
MNACLTQKYCLDYVNDATTWEQYNPYVFILRITELRGNIFEVLQMLALSSFHSVPIWMVQNKAW